MPEEDPDKILESVQPPVVTEPPQSITPFKTGDLARLRSGGPLMTLGQVPPTHGLESQVPCKWIATGITNEQWFYLGQLEAVSHEDAKAQFESEARALELEKTRQHDLLMAKAQNPPAPQPSKPTK